MHPCEAHVYVEDVSDAGVSQDGIDPGEKIHTVVVSAQVSGYAACERVLIRIELRPHSGHRLQQVGSVDPSRPSELPVGRVPPTDAKDVTQQHGHRLTSLSHFTADE